MPRLTLLAVALCLSAGVAAAEPPLAAASRALGAAAAEVYAARDHAPIWTGAQAARGRALLAALREAEAHALPSARYAPDRLEALLEAGDPVEAEIALSRAFLLYARDLGSGLLEPRSVAPGIRRDAPRRDPGLLLAAAAAAPDLAAHLAGVAPQSPDYARLAEAWRALSALDPEAWGPVVPGGAWALREGDRSPRVAALRARLAALGDLTAAPAPEDPERFDAALARDLRAFQTRHGLNADAVVGPRTLEALNAGPDKRAAQIAVNLERMRWMNRPLGHRRIMVNQADFTVTLWEGETRLFHERVVVGTRRDQTVEFSDEMEYLVLNPTWHVPRSIATEDLLPEIQEDPTVLARRNMRLSRSDGGMVPLDPASHDFTGYTPQTFPYRIRQAPSAGNALGRVKFMFPNDFAIYLHDTPSKRLFERDRRAFSHGCVRVRDPLRLAELLLAPQEADPAGFIQRVLATGHERYVNLRAHVPVHLDYRTAWIDEAGRAQFRADHYGRDAAVSAALRAHGVDAPAI
jgi:murein L,D-transpeptidase YcbB/YkuD